jgi:hypothetical protein
MLTCFQQQSAAHADVDQYTFVQQGVHRQACDFIRQGLPLGDVLACVCHGVANPCMISRLVLSLQGLPISPVDVTTADQIHDVFSTLCLAVVQAVGNKLTYHDYLRISPYEYLLDRPIAVFIAMLVAITAPDPNQNTIALMTAKVLHAAKGQTQLLSGCNDGFSRLSLTQFSLILSYCAMQCFEQSGKAPRVDVPWYAAFFRDAFFQVFHVSIAEYHDFLQITRRLIVYQSSRICREDNQCFVDDEAYIKWFSVEYSSFVDWFLSEKTVCMNTTSAMLNLFEEVLRETDNPNGWSHIDIRAYFDSNTMLHRFVRMAALQDCKRSSVFEQLITLVHATHCQACAWLRILIACCVTSGQGDEVSLIHNGQIAWQSLFETIHGFLPVASYSKDEKMARIHAWAFLMWTSSGQENARACMETLVEWFQEDDLHGCAEWAFGDALEFEDWPDILSARRMKRMPPAIIETSGFKAAIRAATARKELVLDADASLGGLVGQLISGYSNNSKLRGTV